MMQIGATQVFHDPVRAGINDIQELSKTHEMVSRAKTELWHRMLTHYLPLYFPEAERFSGSARTDAFLALLEAFPIPSAITAMTEAEFIAAATSAPTRPSPIPITMNIWNPIGSNMRSGFRQIAFCKT